MTGETATAYFRRLATEMRGGAAPSPHDEFIGGLTYCACSFLSGF
ncbi:MAG: hypothetical protein ACE5MB_10020 [Anaerolineae bacterium]